MFGKRGQLFLIAALVISGVLISLAALYTSTQKPQEDKVVYDLSSELNYETAQVIDQAVFTDLPQSDLDRHITNLTDYYVTQNPGSDIIIVYGNESLIFVREYLWKSSGAVSLDSAETYQTRYEVHNWTIVPDLSNEETGMVTINLTSSISQTFRIVSGQNFISVIKKILSNQTYVASGGNAQNEQVITTPPGPGNGRCTGTVPEHATLCPDDDAGLPVNTALSLVLFCTSERKCEYVCNEGYYLHEDACVYYPT